jgi:hypothetical protein
MTIFPSDLSWFRLRTGRLQNGARMGAVLQLGTELPGCEAA